MSLYNRNFPALVALLLIIDDNIQDVIRKRFVTYRDESMPIIDMFEKEGKVRKIIADRSIEEIYQELEALLKD